MGTRVQLHNLLKTFTDNVYYQTPESFKMKYPCIRYSKNKRTPSYADGAPYRMAIGYNIMVISSNPDDEIPDQIAALPMAKQVTRYQSKNLYHDVFDIYY